MHICQDSLVHLRQAGRTDALFDRLAERVSQLPGWSKVVSQLPRWYTVIHSCQASEKWIITTRLAHSGGARRQAGVSGNTGRHCGQHRPGMFEDHAGGDGGADCSSHWR